MTWSTVVTFASAGVRLIETLQHAGYNAVVLTAACEGSAIYPSRLLEPTPKSAGGGDRRPGSCPICVRPHPWPRTLSEDLDELLRFATVIGGRYMGPDRAGEFGRRNAVRGELLVRLRPERVIATSGVAG